MSFFGHDRKYLLLYGCWFQLHTHTHTPSQREIFVTVKSFVLNLSMKTDREHHLYSAEHAGIEDVHAGVDLVGYKHLRFFHKSFYLPITRLKDDHAVLGGLLHPCHL